VQLGLRTRRSLRNVPRHSFTYRDLGQKTHWFVIHMFVQPQLLRAPEQRIELRDIAQIRYHGDHRKHKLTMTPRKSPPQ